ncbi:MAG: hypothetical protein WEF50_05440 [Myxococcota bacterium]
MKTFLALMILVVAVVGGGYYNYARNAHLDADLQQPRPFATLETPDVAQLLSAYEQDAARLRGNVAKAPGGADVIDRFDSSDVGGKAQGFASFQKDNQRWKNARGQVFELEKTITDLRFEKSIRDRGLDNEKTRIWRRLTTI